MFVQSKNWCFTDFELLEWSKIFKSNDDIRYICYGEETCPITKKKHYQGWIQVDKKKRLGGMKKLCQSKKMHMESCRGTEGENEKYCKKDNKYSILGEYMTQGKRTDLDNLKIILDRGGNMEDIASENFQSFIQYNRGFQEYKKLVDKRLRKGFRKVTVIHVHGDTGTGKTRKAMEDTENNVYKIQGKALQWWDGYEGEKTLLIDEYDNDISLTELLGILDGYQLRLSIKGSFTYANWTKVYITSNIRELHIKAKPEHREALKRRITEVIHMCRGA